MKKQLKVMAKLKKAAVVSAMMGASTLALAAPETFDTTDALAQIQSGNTTIVAVFGTLFGVASLILIGRWLLGLFRR